MMPRTDGKMNCLTATYSLKEHTLIDHSGRFRKLSPIECERLQQMPDNFTLGPGISNAQRYKMIGNGWSINVISYIFSHIPKSS